MSLDNKVTEEQSKILKTLQKQDEIALEKIAEITKFEYVKVAKIVLTLSEIGLVESIERTEKKYTLTKEGEEFSKIGLPEKQLYNVLKKETKKILLEDVKNKIKLDEQIVNIAIGWLKRKNWAIFSKEGKITFIELRDISKDIDEEVIQLITQNKITGRINEKAIQESLNNLKKRAIIEVIEKRERIIKLTTEGKKLLTQGLKIQEKLETILTPEMIISGNWKNKQYKPYDPLEKVPTLYFGRKHPVMEVINELREIFLEMGFKEIRGPIVESEFWNFDALFQPQDHPAREMHDTFKISSPSKANLPEKEIVEKVAKTHENGWLTKSVGWGNKWLSTEAERLCLRTHTTATTVRHLSKAFKEWTPPEKVFSIDRTYRNETIDFKHLAEFMQFEGIIVDENVSLRHLKGTLNTFYGKMGFKKIRLIPSYYPYTEPSMSTLIFVEKFNAWFEMGGSGIFRPEVTLPFGVKEKVLAWGQGLDRLVMLKLNLNDIREVYSTNIDLLRNTPVVF